MNSGIYGVHRIRKNLKSRMSPGLDPVSSLRIERNAGGGMNGGEKKCPVKGRAMEREGEQTKYLLTPTVLYVKFNSHSVRKQVRGY